MHGGTQQVSGGMLWHAQVLVLSGTFTHARYVYIGVYVYVYVYVYAYVYVYVCTVCMYE